MFKGRHFDKSIILLCIRWYLAYGLSLRNLEEMMAERGVSVDHSTIHRWVMRYVPILLDTFRQRKRPVLGKWHVNETYIKMRGQDVYLYRPLSSQGHRQSGGDGGFHVFTHEKAQGCQAFLQTRCEERMRRSLRIEPLIVRQSKYMNNITRQDDRRVKRRVRLMLGFKSDRSASVILDGIELIHMIRKGQMQHNHAQNPPMADQFNSLAA